jgi:hypothetical protein
MLQTEAYDTIVINNSKTFIVQATTQINKLKRGVQRTKALYHKLIMAVIDGFRNKLECFP